MRTLADSDYYRRLAFKYAKKCEWCENTERLEVDHIDENPNNNHPLNLRVLCHSCHLKRHGIRERRHKINKKWAKGTRKTKR